MAVVGISGFTNGTDPDIALWFFLPEKREVTHIGFVWSAEDTLTIQGSSDTANGMDGTWETATFTQPVKGITGYRWRTNIIAVSFAEPKKTIRIHCYGTGTGSHAWFGNVHIYGYKAAGETPDDILFCDASTGAEKTALMDWGDRPEGTTLIDSFKVKNASTGKIANDINLQLNHADFLLSWSADGPWTATLDIATLGVGALSNTIYVRNKLEPPLLLLGPYAARVIASVVVDVRGDLRGRKY